MLSLDKQQHRATQLKPLLAKHLAFDQMLSQQHLHISVLEHPDCYEFILKDDGPGIAPEHHEQVFDIFTTLKVNDNSDSTGIGLAIVKRLSKQSKVRFG